MGAVIDEEPFMDARFRGVYLRLSLAVTLVLCLMRNDLTVVGLG
jgi:hypothetical protein